MRNRDYKLFGPGEYFHIYNRGNGKQNIFLENEDFQFFLLRLRQNLFPNEELGQKTRTKVLPAGSFSLISYCLMPNHFHFLLRQDGEIPTTKLLLKVCTSYSIYFNKKYNKVGHVFQDQYKQVSVDDNQYLLWLSAYIHQNPKVGGLTENLGDYYWSSYPEYIGKYGGICDKEIILSQFSNQSGDDKTGARSYESFVESSYKIIKEKKELEHLLLDHIF